MLINWLKSFLLLSILSCLVLALGYLMGGTAGLQIAFILALFVNGLTYFFSDRIVLRLYGAQPLDKSQYEYIYSMVQELSRHMNIPAPRLWIVKNTMANAFATGRSPSHASVAFTTGILSLLEPHELRGVIAHELSHIKNRDTLITTIAAVLATTIGYIAQMLQHAALWASYHGSSNNSSRRNNPLVLLIVSILMPFAAMLIQLALSRSREYLADESGAHYSRDPLALASALNKLESNLSHGYTQTPDPEHVPTAPLFIIQPFTAHGWVSLFSTHPPLKARVERLYELHRKMTKGR